MAFDKILIKIEKDGNLGKENYFNVLNEVYPRAIKLFCEWVDSYKQRVHWKERFGITTKFHDITFEMQIGIIFMFFAMNKVFISEKMEIKNKQTIIDYITRSFGELENKL